MNWLPLTANRAKRPEPVEGFTAYRLTFTAFGRKALLPFFATFCAIALAVPFLSSPCRAEQEDTALDAPSEAVLKPEDTSEKKEESALERRQREEKRAGTGVFSLSTHRQNYFLPLAYNSNSNRNAYNSAGESKPSNIEVKFQLSFKVQLWEKMFWGYGDLFFGYTQLSFWQLYDKDLSSPFRETNYEPEVFFKFDTDFNVLGLRNRLITIGFNHESNGKGGELSRSWNRIFAVFAADRGNFFIALKPWYRIPEDDDEDDNPNIEKYMGYGELFGGYRLKGHVFSFMLRNNLRQNNRGAVEFGWSYQIITNLRLYAQYFNGYGESLVDYDHSVNRIGVGVMLNDWI
jgi:phospholipase A1